MRIGIGMPQLGRFADIDTLRRVAIVIDRIRLGTTAVRAHRRVA
jgi:hypothetical protein